VNLLELVPAFRRHLRLYIDDQHTDSDLAAYLADAIDALSWRWAREYAVSTIQPNTYSVLPDLTPKDRRPIIVMGSIIYKGANVELASIRDGDFAYDPQQGRNNPVNLDILELDKMLPKSAALAKAKSAPLRGFSNGWNLESYNWLVGIGAIGSR
jgi:hypothetical protein